MTSPRVRLHADLSFTSTSHDGSPGASGTVTADGTTINVRVERPVTLAGKSSRRLVRELARSLAKRQLRLVLHGPHGVIAEIGDVSVRRWQRLVTRSRYIHVARLRDVRPGRSGKKERDALAEVHHPPLTPFPLFPTVSTLGPRLVTTTHDPRGGGKPRVIFSLSPWPREGDVQRVEYLTQQRTTIGSAQECDVQIPGLEPIHAVIERSEDDEYVLTHVAATGTSAVAEVPAQGTRLRTGAGIMLGTTRLTYFREEYADHGRPYGGRLGGEIGYQRPQRTPRTRRRGAVGRPRTNRDQGRYYP